VTDGEAQGNPLYTNSIMVYTIPSLNTTANDTITIDVACGQQDLSEVVPRSCSYPLVQNPDGAQCAFACPLPALSDSEYENAKLMQGMVGWFSWVFRIFLVRLKDLKPPVLRLPLRC